MIRAVTFDAAGTLIVPHPSVGAVYAEVANGYGFDADATALDAAFPHAFANVRARWATPFGANDDDARRFWQAVIDETFQASLPYEIACDLHDTFAKGLRWRVLPGVQEALLQIAAAGLPMAVVSNFDQRLHTVLNDLALGPFVAVITSAAVGKPKPDPATMQAAAAALKVETQAILHLGDSEREDGGLCHAVGAQWLRCDSKGIPLAELSAILSNL